MNGLLSCKNTF